MNRKTTLAVAAVVLVAAAAGVAFAVTQLGVLGDDGDAGIEHVPAGVDVVVHVDGDITADQATQTIVDSVANETEDRVGGPGDTDEALDTVENESELDPEKLEGMVIFGKTPDASAADGQGTDDQEYVGVIFHADWSEAEFLEAMRDDASVEYEERTVEGKTMYVPEEQPTNGTDGAVGVLNDGEYVVGTTEAVEDAIAVETGNQDAFDGKLRSAYGDTRDGLVTYAVQVPRERIPTDAGENAEVDVQNYRKVTMSTGVYYTTSNSAGVEMTMYSNTTEGAKDVEAVTSGAVSLASGGLENDSVQDSLRKIEVTREEKRVMVSYEESVDTITVLLEQYRRLSEA